MHVPPECSSFHSLEIGKFSIVNLSSALQGWPDSFPVVEILVGIEGMILMDGYVKPSYLYHLIIFRCNDRGTIYDCQEGSLLVYPWINHVVLEGMLSVPNKVMGYCI